MSSQTCHLSRRHLLAMFPAAAAVTACGGGAEVGTIGKSKARMTHRSPDMSKNQSGLSTDGAAVPVKGPLQLVAGMPGGSGNIDGPRGTGRFRRLSGVAADADGNRFVADPEDHTIRKLDADGNLSTLAGSPGFRGTSDGVGAQARFSDPHAIVADGLGGLYLADTDNHSIRHVDANGVVTTVAGRSAEPGYPAPFGQSQAASDARFRYPWGLAFDGQVLYIADYGNGAIRRLLPNGRVDLFAGPSNGATGPAAPSTSLQAARFDAPWALAMASDGTLWIQDAGNSVIRKIFNGQVFTATTTTTFPPFQTPQAIAVDPVSGIGLVLAGQSSLFLVSAALQGAVATALNAGVSFDENNVDGPIAQASFRASGGFLCHDPVRGRYLLGDTGNHTLREISLVAGQVMTVAGLPAPNQQTVDGPATTARFARPCFVAASQDGSTLVMQAAIAFGEQNEPARLRRIAGGVVTTVPTPTLALPEFPTQYASTSVAEGLNGDLAFGISQRVILQRRVGGSTIVGREEDVAKAIDGHPSVARFMQVRGVAIDRFGRIIVTDSRAHSVRMVSPAGFVSRLAGAYDIAGFAEGPALTLARFGAPIDVLIAADDSILVLDADNRAIFRIAGGVDGLDYVTVVAANFHDPIALAIDTAGNMYVAEKTLSTIVRITPTGERRTMAGRERVYGFLPGPLPGALTVSSSFYGQGMRVINDRLVLTMDETVVQINPLPT